MRIGNRNQPVDLTVQLERPFLTRRCARPIGGDESAPSMPTLEQTRIAQEVMRVQSTLGTLRTRRAQISFAEKDFNELKSEFERVRGELQESKVAAARAQEQVSSATAALAAAQEATEDLKRKVAELEVLQSERRLHEELDRAFSDLRTDLNFQLRPELSELASAFLSELTDARSRDGLPLEREPMTAITTPTTATVPPAIKKMVW